MNIPDPKFNVGDKIWNVKYTQHTNSYFHVDFIRLQVVRMVYNLGTESWEFSCRFVRKDGRSGDNYPLSQNHTLFGSLDEAKFYAKVSFIEWIELELEI